MGLVNLPILNRLGFSNNWNVSSFSKFLDINFFFFFYLLKNFFTLYFKYFFFTIKKKKNIFFFKNNITVGQIYLLKINKWIVCFLNFFFLQNPFLYTYNEKIKKTNYIYFNWKKKINMNYNESI